MEFVGLFLILMPLLNTITKKMQIIIESQFWLTSYLVFLPVLLSASAVRGFNYEVDKWIFRKSRVPKEEEQKNALQ